MRIREVSSEIDIAGSPEAVWEKLIDFEKFEEWNPFFHANEASVDSKWRLVVRVWLFRGWSFSFRPQILSQVPCSELSWTGHLFFPRLLKGVHYFLIKPTGQGKVRFTQREEFSGILVFPLALLGVLKALRRRYERVNVALKDRVELCPRI